MLEIALVRLAATLVLHSRSGLAVSLSCSIVAWPHFLLRALLVGCTGGSVTINIHL